MVQIRLWLLSSLVTVLQYASNVEADGTGLLGYGKTLYNPTCAFACRSVIRKQTLSCTPTDSHQNHGTAHNPVSTPAKCFVKDPTFLKTMALCIDTYCSLSDKPKISLLEDYWASHLGTGTLGDYQYVPVMSYKDALAAAREDENNATTATGLGITSASVPKGLTPYKVSSSLPITTGGSGSLNKTSLVAPVQWQLQFNYLSDFEINEKGHSTMTIVIVVVAIAVPILLSLTQFIPATTVNSGWSRLKAVLIDAPVFGRYHRTPVLGGLVPTRGHSLYIFLISLLNLVLLVAPYTIKQPQASFTTKGKQLLSIIGNRAGTMAMGNAVALILFSSRNSFLLYLTDWSYSTYLLLHRWLGYWTVLHTIIHSAMLCSYYVQAGSYSAEILRLYWQWGIVGTVAVCAIIPFSLLVIRQKLYEFFIVSHIVLSLLFLLGYYYHIWYVYTYNWGYEIWMFIAAAVWAVERLARLIRMAVQGSNTAVVTVLRDGDDEYIRIDIEGKDYKEGVAYLCFPSLSWRFWETHPFSVCYSSSDFPQASSLHSHSDAESNTSSRPNPDPEKGPNGNVTSVEARGVDIRNRTSGTTFYARTRSGVTKALLNKAAASEGRQVRLRILVDGPYNHSGRVHSQLERCSSILCITGGVGITACLAFLRDSKAKDIHLFWSSRKSGLVADLTPTLNALPSNVKVETLVGQRHDLDSIIRQALLNDTGSGPLAILVSGPPGLADDVRVKVVQTVGSSKQSRPYLLLDEAFSW
ncbi:ferric reductase-like protein transmembrane component 4 [Aaosphaeria arxii CBS 175.79]|uniref:Ferric reductase-like protein transmembrane component 4 n=1 Tax=Aaosphaeria arxii CBS 175.79 TaxID=1450172 RepID=A0A6A5Y350_9PLEO|nr:ferric reductase-like protein transmembrane component 4 [Aaosphaeria arxii CBS 175.79]KAF2019955.1 ferric reductase-like protein transmembrane component 4 [Aaosphaeria arxii CBS 175.79]